MSLMTFHIYDSLLSFFSDSYSTIQYLGFGLSGSNSATSMFRADATITWVDENGVAQAQDYYLSNYVQVAIILVDNETLLCYIISVAVSRRIGGVS